MPCDCKRHTFRYACRHKEREFYRCWRYSLKKRFFCVSPLVSNCSPVYSKTRLGRVCNECFDHFVKEFGHSAAYQVSQKFLEFKERSGLSGQAVDPRIVPRDAYIHPTELARLGGAVRSSQPFRPKSPMDASRLAFPHDDIQPEHSEALSRPEFEIPRKPIPTRQAGPTRVHHPVREHGTNEPIDLSDLVDDDSDDDYYSRGRSANRKPIQPLPIPSIGPSRTVKREPSESSLVERITKVAEKTEIKGYPNLEKELPSVPKLGKAPKVPAWRVDVNNVNAAHPVFGLGVEQRAKSCDPVLGSRGGDLSAPRTAPARFVRGVHSTETLSAAARSRTPSQDIVPVPPRRHAGVRAPASARLYHEHGIPSVAYLEEKELEEQHERPSPLMLVSVSTPSPAFSCAVQSCFCEPEDKDDMVCPSCRERRRLERELQMEWI